MTAQTGSDERDHQARSDSHAFIRRVAGGLGIPLKAILDIRRDDDRHVISVIGFNNAAGDPEVHIGTAVLTTDEAMALARDIRRVVAQPPLVPAPEPSLGPGGRPGWPLTLGTG